ncbi:spore germination protein B1 [Paenibacillus montaniterrae]|uniref:Spore germination protein B1 n=1 Tax=Paenibacillus montaniterrae TaxID=429341 RepID=A0A919YNZ2_9BACL|nr:spore germination protein [Paenibacillus montaniterrae]GIP16995.1 spore germination protein B1 [Paenibacillus montaniterrae]
MLERLKVILAPAEDLMQSEIIHPVTRQKLELAYYLPICDEQKIHDYITVPFSKNQYPIMNLFLSNANFKRVTDPAKWNDLLLRGQALVEYQNQIFSFDALKYEYLNLPDSNFEPSIRGPQHSLSEDPIISLNIIRNSYMSPELVIDKMQIGNISQTNLYILYDQRKVNHHTLDNVKNKLSSIHIDLIHSSGELERLLNGKKYQLFPTLLVTERFDRIGRALSFGKIVLILKGSQFALILPVTFYDFMHSVEDHYESYWMTKMIVVIRYIALILTTTLPGLYIAILSYNPEIFRLQLAFTLVASRSIVPYPSFIEVIIMLVMIEMLLEASIRTPKLIGSTSTTVGGLILGTAIQQAGLVSSIMIIVTSLVAISNLVLPIHTMSLAIRFLKYPIIVAAIFFGLAGVFLGILYYITCLCSTRSFGEYYFRLRGNASSQHGDIGGTKPT